jgi:hypothetical protein
MLSLGIVCIDNIGGISVGICYALTNKNMKYMFLPHSYKYLYEILQPSKQDEKASPFGMHQQSTQN